jgi:hypothetical protein
MSSAAEICLQTAKIAFDENGEFQQLSFIK